ncbi:unnamed protein product [Closterium sp. NIES-54]
MSRLGCSMQYEADGAFRTSVAVEDSLDTNERRPADWVSPTWGPGGLSSRLPDHLPPVPALDDKTVVGTRTVLTRNLMVQERENVSWAEEWSPNGAAAAAAAAAPTATSAAAAGFMRRGVVVFSLPQGVVVCAPRSLQLVAGRPFVLSATWVVGAGLVGEGENGIVEPLIHQQQLVAGRTIVLSATSSSWWWCWPGGRWCCRCHDVCSSLAAPGGREAVGAAGVMMCAPRSLHLVAGRPFVLSATWAVGAGVAGEGEVKRMSAYLGADGGLEKVEGEWYKRQRSDRLAAAHVQPVAQRSPKSHVDCSRASCSHARPAAANSPHLAQCVVSRSLRPRALPVATRSLQPHAASRHTQPSGRSYLLLAACRLPAACCLPLLPAACLLPACCLLPAACLLPAYCLLAACLLLAAYSLPACLLAACLPPACSLSSYCLQPACLPACCLPAAACLLAACSLPACSLPACCPGVTQHGECTADRLWHLTGGLRGDPWSSLAGSLRSSRRVDLEEHVRRDILPRGFSQREGVDFFHTFSPTPKMTTLRWHDTLRTTLVAPGFAPSTADPSLFLRTDTSLPPFYILVYVDDLVFATADTEALALVKSELQKRHTCTDLGELHSYLGLHITRDRARHTITLTQSHMVQQVLQRFGFTWSSAQPTPLATGHSLSAPPSDESVEPSGPYPKFVGCLMYLMTCTRPDLAYPLGLLARYVAPGRHRKVHMDAAKRVLRYLCSTSGMGLVLGGRGDVVLTVLSSSCEAEIYATAMAAQELRWLTYLLTDLGERPRSPPVLYVDNKAAIALCQELRLEHRTKHIALRYFLARELQQRGQLRLTYVATRANTADIFTKALPPGDHPHFCTLLGLVPTLPHLL